MSQDDDATILSCAPTDTYLSPLDTPKLSDVDLTLSAHPSRFDLALTLERLAQRQQTTSMDEVDGERKMIIEMPRFGDSPGRTPSPSTPSCPSPSEFAVSEVIARAFL